MKQIRLIFLSFIIMGISLLLPQFTKSVFAKNGLEQIEQQGMTAISENDELILYMNDQTFEFAILVKKSGDIWFSNPPDREQDPTATGINKDLLNSHISVRFNNAAVQEGSMNSYTDSAALGQAEMELIEDGAKVTYTLGKEVTGNLIPQIITIERMESFMEGMDEKEQELVESIYKKETDEGLFILRTASAPFKQKSAEEYFEKVGYTLDEYIHDNTEHGVEGAGGAVFKIPVEYKIDGAHLLATIPMDEVDYPEAFPLTQIRLLEYFGAAGLDDEGYLFVPDGSGALIYLNNNKLQSTTFVSKVYGDDESLNFDTTTAMNKELSARLPVFGIKTEDKAMLAILEEGEAYASVYGDISGKNNSYNKAFSQFNYLPNGESSLDSMTGSGILQLYQPEPYKGNYQVRYSFLTGEAATYTGMAKKYQQYLIERDILKEKEKSEDIPFYLGLVGGIDITKKFMGIPYKGIEVLTSYDQAKSIIDDLKNDHIENIKVKYSGWFNGGMNHFYPKKISLMKGLGKKLSLKEFSEYMNQSKIPLYFDVDFGYVYQDKLFDGFSTNRQSVRYFDNNLVTVSEDDLTKKVTGRDRRSANKKYILNTGNLNSVINRFTQDAAKQNINRLSLRTITSTVSSDFSRKHFIGRDESLQHINQALQTLGASGISMMGDNSNAYAFGYTADILNAPMDSNRYQIIDEAVPFYQLVLHGYVDYAGAPLNLADDYHYEMLKSIETGAGLYFEWIYADNSILKETEYDHLYSVQYEDWYNDAVELYQRVQETLKPLSGKEITGHQKVLDDVYEVSYENAKLYVNYSDKTVQYDGVHIEAKDFAVEENLK